LTTAAGLPARCRNIIVSRNAAAIIDTIGDHLDVTIDQATDMVFGCFDFFDSLSGGWDQGRFAFGFGLVGILVLGNAEQFVRERPDRCA